MLPDRVSNPGPLTYESGALPIALRGPADIWTLDLSAVPVNGSHNMSILVQSTLVISIWLVVLLFYVHGKHLMSCRDGQLT